MFREILISELSFNPFDKISKQWMLISSGTQDKYNTMTASWGGFGHLWNTNVASIFVRPQRYTKYFLDKTNTFTLSFFPEKYKKSLNYLGTVSGRYENKISKTNLTPHFIGDVITFEEAELIISCTIIYKDYLDPEAFLDSSLQEKHYPLADYHQHYIARINKVFVRNNRVIISKKKDCNYYKVQ